MDHNELALGRQRKTQTLILWQSPNLKIKDIVTWNKKVYLLGPNVGVLLNIVA
jgi:hypothetical protein